MKNVALLVISVVFILMGGFQMIYPERVIRYNRDHQRGRWQPQWMRDRLLSKPNVWMTRVAGAAVCVMGVFFIAKVLLTL